MLFITNHTPFLRGLPNFFSNSLIDFWALHPYNGSWLDVVMSYMKLSRVCSKDGKSSFANTSANQIPVGAWTMRPKTTITSLSANQNWGYYKSIIWMINKKLSWINWYQKILIAKFLIVNSDQSLFITVM